MIPNQGNIELVAVGNTTSTLKLVLDSDGATAWSSGKAPVRIVRGAPGDANYWSSDVIKWAPGMTLTPIGLYAGAVEDKWTLPSINSIVDGDNPARELNLRVWPVGLSSIDWQRMINTGHFLQLSATRSAILVATEFASILSLDYKNQREHQSGGLQAYATSAATGDITTTGITTLTAGSKTVTFAVAANSALFTAGDYIKAGDAVYEVASVGIGSVELTTVAVTSATPAAGLVGIKKATATAAEAGIVLEATPNKFVTGQYNYEKTRLQVTTGGMGGITYTAMASEGVGTAEQVAEREWFSKGNEGKPMRTNNMAPYNGPHLETDLTLTYDVFSLGFAHNMLEPLGQPNNSPKGIFVAELAGATALHALLATYVAQ